MATKTTIDLSDPEGVAHDEELAGAELDAHDAHQAEQAKLAASVTFAGADDVERLRLVNERARTDPAYAALADFVLRGVSR